jgi:hypothetical protein
MAKNGGVRRGEKNHAAFEKQTFYQLAPEIITPEVVAASEWHFSSEAIGGSFENRVFKGLYDDARFHDLYVYGKIESAAIQREKMLIGWIRKDFLTRLKALESVHVETYAYTRHNNK